MKALMLHSEDSAVGFYRIWQPAKYLEKLGWEVARTKDSIETLPIDGEDGWEGLGRGTDIIVAQRPEAVENVALFMAMRDHFGAPFVYEIDDNIYDVAESSTAYKYWYPGSPRIAIVETLIKNADAVTVTTEALRDAYSHLNDTIYVLPNCQDPEFWKFKKSKPNKNFTIGWAGSSTHYDDLKSIWRPMKKFLRNHRDVRFKVVGAKCDFLVDHPQVDISTEWSHISKYPQYLADLNFDVGVVPVVSRPFNLGKSNIKWQEYTMVGVPTIASDLGEYKEIKNGTTGFLAKDDITWNHYLEKLYDDRELGAAIAVNSKQYVLKNCNIANRITDYDDAYRNIIRKYKSSQSST